MVSTQGMRRKEDIVQMINRLLDEADKSRRGFTPDVVNEFFREGMAANQRRGQQAAGAQAQATQQQRREQISEMTPRRPLDNMVVSRREEMEQRVLISPHMTQRAIVAAVNLGERIELAAQGRRLNLRDWVTG